MITHQLSLRWLIAGLIIALALTVMPVPAAIAAFKPDWVALILIYCSLVAPERLGLFSAFAMGLALDVLTGARLGQHALALISVIYLSLRFHLRIRVYPVSQVVLFGALLFVLYQFILFWIDGVAGRTVPVMDRIAPVVTDVLLLFVALLFNRQDERDTRARIEA